MTANVDVAVTVKQSVESRFHCIYSTTEWS